MNAHLGSAGLTTDRAQVSYPGLRTLEDTGTDLDSVAAAISFMW